MKLDKLTDEQLNSLKAIADKQTTKLTHWKNEPSISQLKWDYTQASQDQSQHIAKINEWEKLYDAPKFGSDKHKGSRVNPKLVRKQAEWNAPSLSEPFLSTSNLFDVKPLTFDDVGRAKQNALILNRQFNTQLNKTKLVDDIIRQLVKVGTAIVRTGWDFQEKEILEDVEYFHYQEIKPDNNPMAMQMMQLAEQSGQELPPSEYDELQQQYQELEQLKQLEPDTYENLPSEIKAGFEMSIQKGVLLKATSQGFKKQKIKKTVVNKPSIELCNIKNVYIDPTCKGDMDKAQFVIHAFESSLSELKKSNQYTNLDKVVEGFDAEINRVTNFRFADKARQKLTVYEYWGYWDIDKTNETKPIVVTWVGDTIIRMQENPFPDGKPPFVVFNYLPQENSIYGIPNAELLGDNQEILGAVTRGMIDLLGKSANSQTGYMKNFLDPTNKAKFMKGMDYEFNPSTDPRVSVYQHKYPEIPNSAMNIVAMMNNEAESLSGVKAFSGTGISASNLGDVAAGVRGVLDAVSKREMSILRRISDGFIKLGRKIISMNSLFLSEQEIVRITNSEFVTIRRDDLAGEFDLVLTISTAEGDDAKAKELAFMLQTMGNTMGEGIMKMVFSEIATLRKMPDLAKAIKDYEPTPDPMAEQLRELELQKLQAEVQLLQAEAQEALAKSQVQQAKVGTEQAKAQNLQSDADNKTLDFVERESGIKHERELDKQALVNDGITQKEQLRNDGLMAQSQAKIDADMMNQLFNQELSTQQAYQQQGLNQ